jgi:hypothetical protein
LKAPQKSLKDWGDQKWRTKSGKPSTKVQKLQASGISQRGLSRLCHLLNTRHQRKQNEQEKQQENSSSNNPVLLQKRQRGIDNG